MNSRIKISVLLLIIGAMLALLPQPGNKTFSVSLNNLVLSAANDSNFYTVDQVARFINNEATTIQLIDVRSSNEFRICHLPGAINIPLADFEKTKLTGLLNRDKVSNIFYGNDENFAAVAWTAVSGLGFKNNYVMKGGLNEWFAAVMNSQFKGEKISAKENALFENRFNARDLFTKYNSLPDSLKTKLFAARHAEKIKLDGGCE